ncbi:hypothetical protein ACFFSW_16905 [Saccharothrix longispora]|uniref:hypothetical protein n=1 Tax=Saccharothrix longispora TaxID=33920 RepID=UPI0031EF8668
MDNRWGAFPVALCAAVAYAVVGGAAGVLALRAATPVTPTPTAGAPPLPVVTAPPSAARTAPSSAPSSAPAPVPPGFRTISAPGGLSTVVPASWSTSTGTAVTTLVAVDPADARREVRLGGAPVTDPAKTLPARITEAAVDREREAGHSRIALSETSTRGFPAVRWEFEEGSDRGPKRVAATFWEVGGVEYVLYAAGPPDEWATTRELLDVMIRHATP